MNSDKIRLVGGRNNSEGRVEVFYRDEWRRVCNTEWGINDANVVCRQVGYPAGSAIPPVGTFGSSTGPAWLDNLRCNGRETKLRNCSSSGFGDHNCSFDGDANIACRGLFLLTSPCKKKTF